MNTQGPPTVAPKPDWIGRILALCAIAVTCLMALKFFQPAPVQARPGPTPPVAVKHWQTLRGSGTLLGKSDAPVTILEFTDLQCPVCRVFARIVDSARARYGDTLALEIVHYPLTSIHPHALPAARAAECAKQQGRFEQFVSKTFEWQDSLGKKPWKEFAASAQVADLNAFDVCQKDTAQVRTIARGLSLGDSLKLTGTPTLIINGWRFGGSISTARLDSVIRSILTEQRKSH